MTWGDARRKLTVSSEASTIAKAEEEVARDLAEAGGAWELLEKTVYATASGGFRIDCVFGEVLYPKDDVVELEPGMIIPLTPDPDEEGPGRGGTIVAVEDARKAWCAERGLDDELIATREKEAAIAKDLETTPNDVRRLTEVSFDELEEVRFDYDDVEPRETEGVDGIKAAAARVKAIPRLGPPLEPNPRSAAMLRSIAKAGPRPRAIRWGRVAGAAIALLAGAAFAVLRLRGHLP